MGVVVGEGMRVVSRERSKNITRVWIVRSVVVDFIQRKRIKQDIHNNNPWNVPCPVQIIERMMYVKKKEQLPRLQ